MVHLHFHFSCWFGSLYKSTYSTFTYHPCCTHVLQDLGILNNDLLLWSYGEKHVQVRKMTHKKKGSTNDTKSKHPTDLVELFNLLSLKLTLFKFIAK